jgi:ABC-type oligopeptide transport system ATPase subunit
MITGTGIVKTFKQPGDALGKRHTTALRGVEFAVPPGGAISFIGESGCGKTTLGRIIAGLKSYDEGGLVIDGVAMSGLRHRGPRCPFRTDRCVGARPVLGRAGDTTHEHACFYPKVRQVTAVPAGTA